MAARPSAGSIWGGRTALVVPGLALLLGALAYRPLLLVSARLPFGYEIEGWLFRPDRLPAPFVVAVAAWLLWRRRTRLVSLPPRSGAVWGLASAVLAATGAALFVWALLTRAADLLLPSLAANLLAFGAAAKGGGGCRAVLLPACVLLLGLRIPEPILDELVWHLQLSTAIEAGWILRAMGYDVAGGGVVLYIGESTFHVIGPCSGMRGIQILTVVGLIVRELFASSGPRQWWVVVAAPILGHGLNAVRIALIALSSDPDALVGRGADHSPQGIAVLVVGTVLLYALGWGLAKGRPADAAASGELVPDAFRVGRSGWLAPAWLGLLALLSAVVSPFPQAADSPEGRVLRRPGLLLPENRGVWVSESLDPDMTFISTLPEESRLYRRYKMGQRSDDVPFVEVFVGVERRDLAIQSSRVFSSKRLRPGPEWSVEESEPIQLWVLGQEAELAVTSRTEGSELALVYCWRLRDAGFWKETLRSLFSLESTPFRPEGRRVVVRLATPLAGRAPGARARAKRTLDHFVNDFRRVLEKL